MKQLNLYYLGGGGDTPSVPDGRTVTPVNDVTIWQKCAGLTPTYTTLEQILADTGVLMALMVDENAVDYLVRSKAFMGATGGLVPAMTDNTHPSGECITDPTQYSTFYPYFAFDGVIKTTSDIHSWLVGTTDARLIYKFPSAKIINSFVFTNYDASYVPLTYKIQASDDGTTWKDIYSGTNSELTAWTTWSKVSFPNTEAHQYWAFKYETSTGNSSACEELQFYFDGITTNSTAMSYIGANDYTADTLLADGDWCEGICNSEYFESVLNVKVPTMTSNTTPSGECFADSDDNTAYYPFDDVASTTYVSANGTTQGKVWYQFTQSVKIFMCETKLKGTGSTRVPYGKFVSSNDGITFNDITTEELAPTEFYKRILATSVEATCFGVNVRETSSATNFAVVMLQFYGRAKGGVQSLLRAAGITNKSYSTVAQLLLDSTSLQTIISSQAGVDYLAQCTAFAEAFASSSTAMTMIGNNNYASNTLLAVPEWAEAIANSTYFESVLNASSPLMTGPTSPSGEAFGYQCDNAGRPAWKGFGNADGGQCKGGAGQYLGYIFPYDVKVVKVRTRGTTDGYKDAKIEAYNEDTLTWIELASGTLPSDYTFYDFVFSNSNVYTKYRILSLSTYQNNYSILYNLKFYGRKDI